MDDNVQTMEPSEIPEEIKSVKFTMKWITGDNPEETKDYYMADMSKLINEMFALILNDENIRNLSVTSEIPGVDLKFNFYLNDDGILVSSSNLNFAKNNPVAYLQGFYNYVNKILADMAQAMQKAAMTELDGDDTPLKNESVIFPPKITIN